MSKKLARTFPHWGSGGVRRRRHLRPHVRRSAGRAFGVILVAIPAGLYLLYCLCRIGGETHFHLMPAGSPHIRNGSPFVDGASTTRPPASEVDRH
ncbi:hypothetical protein [Methylobacterium sp. Leaf111]|uniref:hypothetical protein n=1 Tax=Methylobacterium sp. Leaf111 TaxID=1736257 RepID=UPI0007021067|nr:hypothetical protein [Methylobacterium sp. Leaf111]